MLKIRTVVLAIACCAPAACSDQMPTSPAPPSAPSASLTSTTAVLAGAGDIAQQTWLVTDLASHRDAACTIAYFHHPRFSSGQHGNHFQMQKIWDLLYGNGVDLVVSGHDHLYERFAPQNPYGVADATFGICQLTVGTGGAELYSVSTVQPNSEIIINDTHGIVVLRLGERGYAWSFVDVNRTIRDSGEGSCHGAPI